MEQSIFTDTELQLAIERRLKYQGTAKIELSQLSFHPSASRQFDQNNVDRLCEVFRKDGCHRLEVQNHISGVVTSGHLKRARQAAQITAEELLTNSCEKCPMLSFSPGQVLCLHGQHRLRAAEDVLAPSEQWWTVDLYLNDISYDLRNTLIDEYSNEKMPSDGEIYRKLRQYQNEHNAPFQKRWWARLSENKAKRLRQLMSPDNVDICAAFDALLPIPGLWDGMSIGSLNRVLALKCDEEIIHYLQHVKRFWFTLVDGDLDQMAKIDTCTVKALELKAPTACKLDARKAKGLILSAEAFVHFNETERNNIWQRLAKHDACDGIIPSLHTFFRDINYLEACANGIKQLVELKKGSPTVRAAMKQAFNLDRSRETCLVQTSETAFRSHAGPKSDFFELSYRQIWLFVMRHYPQMAREATSKKVVAKSNCGKADEVVLYSMAVLSQKLGFHSKPATDLLKRPPDRQIAREALLKARKPGRYRYNLDTFELLIDRVVECFTSAVPDETLPSSDLIRGGKLTPKYRCGPPRQDSQLSDRPLLFMDQMHLKHTSSSNLVSSFYVRQCVYFAFFGKPFEGRIPDPADTPGSPLFVPLNDPSVATASLSLPLEVSMYRQSRQGKRRERARQQGGGGRRSHKEGRRGTSKDKAAPNMASHLGFVQANQHLAMHESIRLATEDEDMISINSSSVVEAGKGNDFEIQDYPAHELRSSPEPNLEIFPDVGHETQEEREYREPQGDQVLIPETRSIPELEDTDCESSLLSDPVSPNWHEADVSENIPPLEIGPQQPSQARSSPTSPLSDKSVYLEEQELPSIAETQGEVAQDEAEQSIRLSQPDEVSLEQRTEGRLDAEDGVRKALQELEQAAEIRTLATDSVQVLPEEQPASAMIEQTSTYNPQQPIFTQNMDLISQNAMSNNQISVPMLGSAQVAQQRRMEQSTRATKAITRFGFAEMMQHDTQTDKNESRHREPSDSPKSLQQGFALIPEPSESSNEEESRKKKSRRHGGDVVGTVDSNPAIGEVMILTLPEALSQRQIALPSALLITFKAYEKGLWRVTDRIQIDQDLSQAERIAMKYARQDNKHARFYRFQNNKLSLVSVAECVRAAISDGSNTVLMNLHRDLEITQETVAEVAKMLKADRDSREDQSIK
ncbi:hypothetical protein N7486_005017 [Penicillium sp. IBT 16267x]|nr:hypothetical protein N7486_005017 [Penicillium sp. IBT 16267x]